MYFQKIKINKPIACALSHLFICSSFFVFWPLNYIYTYKLSKHHTHAGAITIESSGEKIKGHAMLFTVSWVDPKLQTFNTKITRKSSDDFAWQNKTMVLFWKQMAVVYKKQQQ